MPATQALVSQLKHSISAFCEIALAAKNEPADKRSAHIADNLCAYLLDELATHGGCALTLNEQMQILRFDADINAQGLSVWLDRLV